MKRESEKHRLKKRKLYTWIVFTGILSLSAVFGISYMHLLHQVLIFQKNMIGVLHQIDEIHVENYIYAMYEPVTQAHVESGMQILKNYGYTEKGIYYIGNAMGIFQNKTMWAMLWILTGIVLFFVYKLIRIQHQEREMFQNEIDFLKQNQMKEEYLILQNKRVQSFIENIAHQMKTPLSRVYSSLDIVLDMTEVHLKAGLEEKQENLEVHNLEGRQAKQYIEECYKHLESINGLMKRLMDIGRLEAGKIIFQKERVFVKELLEDIKQSLPEGASRIQISCEEQLEYHGDEKWLKEAFSNILSNSLEADRTSNKIEVVCSRNEDYFKFSIRDHGPGLSEQDIPNIFDRFYLPENVKENHTGIGLNLAKLVIEGHQGSVYAYNHLEGGAVFQVLLPVYDTLKIR